MAQMAVPEKSIGRSFRNTELKKYGFSMVIGISRICIR